MSIRPSETRKVMTRANALASAPNSTVLRTPPLPDTRLTPSHHLVVTLTESSKLDSRMHNSTLPHLLADGHTDPKCFPHLNDALASCTKRPMCGGVVRSTKGCDSAHPFSLRANSSVVRRRSFHSLWIRSSGRCPAGRRGGLLKAITRMNQKLKKLPIPKEDAYSR